MQPLDALVIGGGPAGATAAILLAEAGWSVGVVEQKVFPRRKVCGEYLSATNWPLLARLGVSELFEDFSGPPVTSTAIFSGRWSFPAQLPKLPGRCGFGRALSRERLDTLLLGRASALGATVLQPARCVALTSEGPFSLATVESAATKCRSQVAARVVIAAHGSWDVGDLPTQQPRVRAVESDWLAFKAHFREASLPTGLMPLLSFEDGYGGMAHVEGGRVSLSFCIRRRRLERFGRSGGVGAGEAALAHILESCPAVENVLEQAVRDGPWLSAGVIRPGVRTCFRPLVGTAHPTGVFFIGNAAGEAHPVVAEGISMAMQAAWLLCERLKPFRSQLERQDALRQIVRSYSAAWRRAFVPRIYAAAAVAHWASRPRLVRAAGPLLAAAPSFITWGARVCGKSSMVVQDAFLHGPEWNPA